VEIQEAKDHASTDIFLMVRISRVEFEAVGNRIIAAAAKEIADVIVDMYIEKHGADILTRLDS
jgi:hypothetical protein